MKKGKEQLRTTSIGGQAVIEGVMMRGKKMYALAVRNKEKEIDIKKVELASASDKYKFLKLPLVRGVVSFASSLVIGMKTITMSAEMSGLGDEEGESSKFEKFLERKFGDKLNDYIMTFSVVLAIAFAIGLFMLLPVWITSFFKETLTKTVWGLSLVEGLMRIAIFLVYIVLISRMKEIKRVFEYHGAEHKTINCYEHNEELTVENVKKYTRIHKRCGTSFLLFVMVISLIVFMFVRTDDVMLRLVSRIILVPVIAGLSYEVIKWAGRSDNKLVSLVSYPGMLLQRLTTKEPDGTQIEVAIAAMNEVLLAENQDKLTDTDNNELPDGGSKVSIDQI